MFLMLEEGGFFLTGTLLTYITNITSLHLTKTINIYLSFYLVLADHLMINTIADNFKSKFNYILSFQALQIGCKLDANTSR